MGWKVILLHLLYRHTEEQKSNAIMEPLKASVYINSDMHYNLHGHLVMI